MIIVKLQGGLGNQMFQYSAGYALSHVMKDELRLDVSWFKQFDFPHLQLEVNKFDLKFPEYANPVQETVVLDGYFQNPVIFDNYKRDLRKIFVHDFEKLPSETIAMHIRRNDYVKIGRALSDGYYNKALNILNVDFSKVVIFTDDPEYAKEHYPSFKVFESVNPIYDMLTMSTASKFIIANSSFSWWSAYLSISPVIIYPDSWNEYTNCVPKEWQGI